MNGRAAYRRTRIAVGTGVLGLSMLAFANVGGWLSIESIRGALWFQFVPSLLSATEGLVWLSAGFLAVLVLTLLFGRVYCAALCPLGVLMDVSAWLARRNGRKRALPYRSGQSGLRISVVALCLIGLLAGLAWPLAFLDPYSVFGKITSATLRPVIGSLNNLLSTTGWGLPVKWSPVDPVTLAVALGLLAAVVALAVTRGRLWCNTVCPVGAVLGLFSRHALFRLKIEDSECVGCSVCERVCPAQCIDFRNHRIDHSRCVMCFDCVTSCKRSGIHLDWLPGPGPEKTNKVGKTSPASPKLDRRGLIVGAALVPAVALAGGDRHPALDGGRRPRPVLPPGAQSLEHFQSLCTACHLCVTNCPEQVLRPSITAHGLAGFLQPYQDFEVSFCSYNCSNCSQICPTGAIQSISTEERRTVRTGVAHFFQDLCVVKTEGTSCGACNEHCPTQAVHMVPWKDGLTIPQIDEELCIGCGGCEFICPVRPDRAIVVDGLNHHETAMAVDRGRKNKVREIAKEFPF